MDESAILIALLSAIVLVGAWHEHAAGNRRDARLMTGIGTCAGLVAVAVAVG